MRAIVVGARGTTRELLRRLGEVWDVVVVSTSEDLLKSAAEIRPYVLERHAVVALNFSREAIDDATMRTFRVETTLPGSYAEAMQDCSVVFHPTH